ncbi:MAG TPA: ATP-grasp domain-containing protein [Chloroflexota bacterium]|nr:ATP-grasp domain-containing protein [Chloroflexota bacterium]
MPATPPSTILLLTTPHTYRAEAFMAAAKRLAIPLVTAVDLPPELAQQWPGKLALDFRQPDTAVQTICDFAQTTPLTAILPVDDSGVLIAARASQALGLPHNRPEAATAARDKLVMRQLLQTGGVPTPPFYGFDLADTLERVTAVVQSHIGFPCVVKPRTLNGSRGVIRANDVVELATAVRRVQVLLQSISADGFLVEGYLPGVEVALEAVLDNGRLQPLALFDKPDPLEGPFFEETIYVTPSRLPAATQTAVVEMAAQGAQAIGLQTGSVHAELRLNEGGAWIVEVNGRSIGGLCSQTLRFDMGMSLEELLLRQVMGLDITGLQREQQASGVMMIPIPRPGILRRVEGIEAAQAVPGIDEITITVPEHHRLAPLPEGESYLGFIFATGQTPDMVEEALRVAHGRLHFVIDEEIPLLIR